MSATCSAAPLRGPRHERAEKDKEELHAMVSQIMNLTNVAFFGLAGASLKVVGCHRP